MQTIPNNTAAPSKWPRYRPRAVDKRTRAYRIWAERRARLVRDLGRAPTEPENALLDLLADRLIDADVRRDARQRGSPVDHDDSRVASEIRRLMIALGLIGKSSPGGSGGLGDFMDVGS